MKDQLHHSGAERPPARETKPSPWAGIPKTMTAAALEHRRHINVKHGAYGCDVYSARAYIASLDAALADVGALMDQSPQVDLRHGVDRPHDSR